MNLACSVQFYTSTCFISDISVIIETDTVFLQGQICFLIHLYLGKC